MTQLANLGAARLHHICISSNDAEKLANFYGDVLCNEVTKLNGSAWRCHGPGREVVIVPGPPNTLGYAAFAVDSGDALSQYKDKLAKAGVSIDPSPSPLFSDESFCVSDPNGNQMVFGVSPESAATSDSPLSARLQHVVVATDDLPQLISFYSEIMRFTLSDVVTDEKGEQTACFFRTDPEHHSFAMFRAPEKRFDHHCYEAKDWNAIRDWCDHFAEKSIELVWGPGRHGPGNNLFCFIRDPDGNWIEISAELEVTGPDRVVGTWRHEPHTLNLWGEAHLRS